MDPDSERSSVALRRLVNGYQITQAIHVATTLGIADLLAGGPRSSDDLAAETGAHPGALYRLMRALAGAGVFRETEGRRFALTGLGDCLRADGPDSLAGWTAFVGEPYHWQVWGDLLHSVQTGETAFHHVHGTDPWTYRARHPESSARFDRAMASLSRQVAAAVLAAYDFGRFGTVVDIAGGSGTFLAAILARHATMRGILFDLPHVVAGAGPILAAAGVVGRCTIVEGSFFEAVPPGGDAYVLKAILHDWDDEDCVRILQTCRQAMTGGRRSWRLSGSWARRTKTRMASSRTSTCLPRPGDGSGPRRNTARSSPPLDSSSPASRRARAGQAFSRALPHNTPHTHRLAMPPGRSQA